MKTNISIELTDEERLNLGKKYYKKKKMITRYDLNELVKKYIYDVLEATPPTAQEQKIKKSIFWNTHNSYRTLFEYW